MKRFIALSKAMFLIHIRNRATLFWNLAFPIFILLMVLMTIFLFDALRPALIIWLCVPLIVIGVVGGLLFAHQPFNFVALLGLLSLTGMLVKNAIVLLDQIELEIQAGKPRFEAIVDSGVSRMRPVMMATMTTVPQTSAQYSAFSTKVNRPYRGRSPVFSRL